MPELTVYVDFTCPDCYLAARRTDVLAAAGAGIDLRVVERDPHRPVTGLRLSAGGQRVLTDSFGALQDLLLPGEQLPWSMPLIMPKSEASVSAYAEAYGSPVAADVRRLLFELYWRRGMDIGNPNALRAELAGPMLRSGSDADPLRRIGFAVAMNRAPITTGAYQRIRTWRREWAALGRPDLPLLLVDGATLSGTDALRRLGKEISYLDADIAAEPEDAAAYPALEVRPSMSWVSQTGGRWRTAYRPHSPR